MNGQVRYRIFYRDGDIYHGEYSMRNMDGSPSLRRTYRNGIEHGESIAYGKNNEPISHLLYINGTVYKNLLLQPLGQEDKFLLSMEYDIVWIE
jgi:antitoxin component YwqK of YwqJK toxin-antitoxin module